MEPKEEGERISDDERRDMEKVCVRMSEAHATVYMCTVSACRRFSLFH